MAKRGIKVIDLFCGIGGLSQGFVQEDFNVVAGFDVDETCRFAYQANNNSRFYNTDITALEGKKLKKLYGKSLKILVGCAPCQPFSSYSFKIKEKDSKKVNLLYSFLKLVQETEPTIISMENVPQLTRFDNGQIFNDFCIGLEALGYKYSYQIVYCPDYGIPQRRRRLVLLASKLGGIKLMSPTHEKSSYVTVRDVISDLAPINAGETDPNDSLHKARVLSDINLRRIQVSTQGGSWRDWPEELILTCFKKESGRTYSSVYGRMRWDEPAPTMTTQCTGLGNGRFGHPEQDRAISLREAARFQTFPDTYKFYEDDANFNPSVICRQIGNAVPPLLGRVIAKSIKKHLQIHGIWRRKKDN